VRGFGLVRAGGAEAAASGAGAARWARDPAGFLRGGALGVAGGG